MIPLLSAASMHERDAGLRVRVAHEVAEQAGKPRILPVRVAYDGPLNDEIAGILDRVQYTVWEGPQDDERLIEELLYSLRNPTARSENLPLEPVGEARSPHDSRFWIVRPTETEFRTAIGRGDSIVLIKGAKCQMGKTSLLARGLQQARDAGAKCVRTDLQKLNTAQLENGGVPSTWRLAISSRISWTWTCFRRTSGTRRRGANINFERYLRREALKRRPGQLCGRWMRWIVCSLAPLRQRGLRPVPLLAQRPRARPDLALVPAHAGHLLRHGSAPVHQRHEPVAFQRRHAPDASGLHDRADRRLEDRRYGSPLQNPQGICAFPRASGRTTVSSLSAA